MTMQGPPVPQPEPLNRVPDVKVPGLLNSLGLGQPQISQNLKDRRRAIRFTGAAECLAWPPQEASACRSLHLAAD